MDFSFTAIDMDCSGPNPMDLFVAIGATFALVGCYWAFGRQGSIVKRIGLAGGAIILGLLAEGLMAVSPGTVYYCMEGRPLLPLPTTLAAALIGALARPVLAHFSAPTLFKHNQRRPRET